MNKIGYIIHRLVGSYLVFTVFIGFGAMLVADTKGWSLSITIAILYIPLTIWVAADAIKTMKEKTFGEIALDEAEGLDMLLTTGTPTGQILVQEKYKRLRHDAGLK